VHLGLLRAIVAKLSIPVEFGGGVRTLAAARTAFSAGASRLILGTVALEAPDLLEEISREFPGRVYVALDARDGKVATRGWTETSRIAVADAARGCGPRGAAGFIFTDVSRDGTERGVNVQATVALAEAAGRPVIASGGVASLDDIRALRAVEDCGIAGVIIGKALYTGALHLTDVLAAAE
jgi:phosphoribosylformimino-5-aminoimidazole carboxamide ribotide isomerase